MKCYIYLTAGSYNNEKPEISLDVYSVRRDGDYLMIEDTNGYNHIVNMIEVFAVTYK
ncbi:hypothetical protein [Clostridium paridis]|uniref:Uncharacterized protein n=1 Tax=Clostridium paridis TaxID=2803863 RepID=A0A937FKA0_9CLOT|nr:hypothetical protein [Clostridium paridis]MBL4934102.1 hypothetical protein [Clostridium paridis]